jgi:hypothetical protein
MRKARELQLSSVRKERTPIRVENKDLLRNRINKLPKLPFALPQLRRPLQNLALEFIIRLM